MEKFLVQKLSIAVAVVLGIVVVIDLVVRIALPSPYSFLESVKARRNVLTSSRPRAKEDIDARLLSRLAAPGLSHAKHLVAVMVENHEQARPYQEGINDALLIEEFPVEGFIARFALIFDADHFPSRVGPVRSLRPYFIDALQPWVSTVIHAGGSPEALDRARNGDITADNLLYFYSDAERDDNIPAPHNLFLRDENAEKLLSSPLPSTDWPPYAIGDLWTGSAALTIHLNYHNPAHDVTYSFSQLSDAYVRSSGSVENQGKPRNVLLLEMPVTNVGEMGRLTIPVSGRGRALLFRSGKVQVGWWRKNGLREPFSFTTADGRPFLFAAGQTWLTALPGFDRVKWE